MDTVLEQQRRFHEEKERLIQSVVNELLEKKGTVKEQTNSDHRAKLMQDRYMTITKDLKELYEDKEGYRREEIKVMSGPKAFGQFYAKLKSIKDFYKSHPTEIAVPMSIEFENLQKNLQDPVEDLVKFTDEEGHGKYLDLHQAFEKYLNIKGIEPIDYVSYLTNFDKFYEIPKEKKTTEYKRYLQFLLNYLTEYCGKAYPLLDVNEEIKDVEEKFTNAWNEGTFPGWPQEDSGDLGNGAPQDFPPIDLDSYSSPEELASLGLDRLKHALKSMNLKCGGTLEERAKRLFDAKGKRLDELPSSFLAKEKAMTGKQLEQMRKKEIASLEARLYYFSELFGEQKVSTKENVQRKQAMAAGEIERELSDDEEIDINSSDDDLNDDNDIPYNPKNLPLSWDGKPIPYWLYKLHGLNINYNCEICGNQIYRGPKAFQRHFSEWRHAHGMRCLGIPNTAHFANVTNIEDAVALWEKLKIQKNIERWKPEIEEEYEDTEGNVVNRRTYEDLKRQDLL